MYTAIQIIEEFIKSDLIILELCTIPKNGISDEDIKKISSLYEYKPLIDSGYIDLLKKWNYLDIDIIRFYGFENKFNERNCYYDPEEKVIIFASDPAGFLYGMNEKNEILSVDTKLNLTKIVSRSFQIFVEDYIFGKDSIYFMGEEWFLDLKKAKFLNLL